MIRAVEDNRQELEALCRKFRVQRLDLFGSGAGGGFQQETSDLDFLVEFQQIEAGAWADAYFGLLEELKTLFRRDVDLVVISAVTNPYFRQSIERTRTNLYAA